MDEKKIMNHSCLAHHRYLAPVLGVFLAVLTISFAIDAYQKIQQNKGGLENTLSVSGEGRIFVTPDIGTVNVGVVSEAKTVDAAAKDNTDKINKITQGLKDLGVAENDLKTIDYNVYPKYSYPQNAEPEIKGYEARQTLTVKIRDLGKSGEIIEKATSLGANTVSSLNFTVDEPENYRQEAREEAIEQARSKAEALADKLGVRLGELQTFSENAGSPVMPMYYDAKYSGIGGMGGAESAPAVQVGENEIVITVNLIYQIK